jgi:CRP-like cAMP-binding protein
MDHTQKLSLEEIEASLKRQGAERLSYRPGQVLQYQHQTPRGYFFPVAGSFRMSREQAPDRLELYAAPAGPRLFPEVGTLDLPFPYTLEASSDVTLWFFSRFLCQPGSPVMQGLEGLHRPDNLLFQLWRLHVTST